MTPQSQSVRTRALCGLAPVVPVIVIRDPARAEGLAQALVAGGLPILEVTLRTEGALAAIRNMAHVPGGHVGAGTVLTPEDVHRAKDAGASFAVSPGITERLVRACEDAALPLLPGTATATEVMVALDYGFDMLKFFPAEAAGGVKMLKSLGGPLPRAQFCPTGGVSPGNAAEYLALPNVVCVGGSWVVPDSSVADGDWRAIEDLARTASQIGKTG